ncbi:MAG: hypothetical protein ACREEK_23620 [Bradyrhizobium sp.]
MSEQQSEPTKGETGTVGTGPAAPDMSAASEQLMAAAPSLVDSPMLAPDQEATSKADAPKVEAIKAEAPQAEAPKVEAVKAEAAKVDPPHIPGKLLIMSPGERAWTGDEAAAEPEAAPSEASSGKRRMSAMAAVVALATVAGAMGGALATAGLGHFLGGGAASNNLMLEASVARIDADIVALKASVEHTSKTGVSQFNKTSDRLDKVEKAQAEPAAKLSEAVEKLRTQPAPAPVAAAPAANRDVTGSIAAPAPVAAAAVPLPAPKPEIARLPTVEGWVLRDVENGSALIQGRQGMFEVYAGDPVPGLGRVDAIRKQDGKWVVVTSKGLIVAR